ncbi:MAG TPA: exonuclease domain-containing protein [Patescibacteria group bacterium]|nr:exonuclease domain-containing protein [Patescibacteria group bacterium]
MRLASDIILFDIETTGQNLDKDHIIQLSAVVLDRENLLEKNIFNSYIRTSLMDTYLSKQAEHLQVPLETMKKAPKNSEVVKQFIDFAPPEALISTHQTHSLLFLRNLFKKTGYDYPFSSQIFSVWSLGYLYTLQHGMRKQPSFETLLHTFKLTLDKPRNSLSRVRVEAEILRRLLANFTN